MERYLDRNLSARERAEDLLSRMSIEEKLAQTGCVLVPAGREKEACAQLENGIGEISTLEVRMLESVEEVQRFQRTIQKAVMDNSPHHIPAIFHMEGLCGGFIQGNTSFPSGIARASSWDPELEEKIGSIVARQENAAGITHTLAPVLDISRDPRMGRQGESYGEDPTLAAALGAAYTKGLQEETVTCPLYEKGEQIAGTGERRNEGVAKHFMGFHNSEGGIHGADSHTPPRMMREIYGKPFQAAITESHLRGIMPCYCTFDGEAASASKTLLTDILRNEMGFDGVAASDYSGVENVHKVQKMYESVTEAGLHAMEAGMDVEMPVRSGFNDELTEWFRSGKADMAVLDRAVLRILEAKFRMGLFEHPFALEGQDFDRVFYQDSDKKVTLQSARESMVLMKNDGVLPLDPKIRKIAVVGCHAANARSLFGGYTHISMVEAVHAVANSIAGIGDAAAKGDGKTVPYIPGTQIQSDETEEFDAILRQIKPEALSLLEELKRRLPDVEITYSYGYPIAGNDMSGHAEALRAIEEADLCIMTLGGKHGSCSVASMGEGVDGTDINLPECQEVFIRKAAELGKPLVGVHFNGRPISSDAADECLNAILEAWNPSETGAQAIVDVLSGVYNPSGKLPVCVAYHAGQIPVYYNHPNGSSWHQGESIGFANYVDMPHTPRYFFGHGLSYTEFTYGSLSLDWTQTEPDECVKASLSIKNTGSRAGTEIVQLYLKDLYASMTRPVMELAGFARVDLLPGEEKRVEFEIHPSQAAFVDAQMRWKTEAGKVEVLVGASSEDIRERAQFTITEDQYIDGKNRRFYADVKIK